MISENKTSTIRRLLAYGRPYWVYLILSLLCGVISVTLSLLTPVLIGNAIDYILGPGQVDFTGMGRILTYLGCAVGFSALFQWLMIFCTNKITFHTIKDLRKQTFDKINQVPLKYIDGHSHGNVIDMVVNDIDIISDGLLQGFAQLFTGIITIVGTVFFMLSINVFIGLTVILLTPLSLFVAAFVSKKTYRKFSEQSKIRGEMSGYVEEMIGNQKVLKAFHYEDRAIEKFKDMNGRLYDCGVKAQFYSSITNPSTRFVNGIVYAMVGILGALRAIQGNMSIGQLSSFLSYANQYTKPFNEISGVVTELQSSLASAKRVFELLDEEIEVEKKTELKDIECDGSIDIRHVYFSYNKDNPLIEDLNLEVKPGQRVAIVGPTGCGKTTIINLLMRFYEVDAGEIQVSGVDIKNMNRTVLRKMYGMVLQETWLFHGTVKENIAYGKEDASMEEIIEAAKASHAHSFIKRLPNGYDTVISEDGNNISQGQKQLLSIARIMLMKPPMLILDEATSNIDTRTERDIQKAFLTLMKGRTSFIVAHRLSTIQESDIILVMDRGHVIEQGNHEELLHKGGFYANLYNSQFVITE